MNYSRLKTNLRLAINRLKLLEKKKTELAQQARREIAQFLGDGKDERARIRVEHIIREDYVVEAMEMIEMYCDLLLARFGLLEHIKAMDEGLEESITSLIWASPRLQNEVGELKVIVEQFEHKFGKQYCQSAKDNAFGTVNQKLMRKLSVQAPKQVLVEQYLVEIAKNFNVQYEPDPRLMQEAGASSSLIELGAGVGMSTNPMLNPQIGGEPQTSPFSSPHHRPPRGPGGPGGAGGNAGGNYGGGGGGGGYGGNSALAATHGGFSSSIYPSATGSCGTDVPITNLDDDPSTTKPRAYDDNIINSVGMSKPTAPNYQQNMPPHYQPPTVSPYANINSSGMPIGANDDALFNLPDVPGDDDAAGGGTTLSRNNPNETIDVNDLARRFENLRKK